MAAAAASSVQDDGADKKTAGQEGAWKIVGPGGKALADGKTVDKEAVEGQLNRGGLNLSGLVGRLREGEELITSTPRKTVGEVRVGDWMEQLCLEKRMPKMPKEQAGGEGCTTASSRNSFRTKS